MQKINFQNLPSTTTPVNATNLNQVQTNVENEFNKLENYSTTEQVIGTWIDNKPVYRRILSQSTASGANYQYLFNNVDTLISSIGFIKYDGSNARPINMVGINQSNSFFRIDLANDTHSIYANYSEDLRSKNYVLTLEYTKTTD